MDNSYGLVVTINFFNSINIDISILKSTNKSFY